MLQNEITLFVFSFFVQISNLEKLTFCSPVYNTYIFFHTSLMIKVYGKLFFNLWPQSAQQFLIPPSTEKQFIHIRKTSNHGKF